MGVSTKLDEHGEISAWIIDEVDPDKACVMLRCLINTRVINPLLYNYAHVFYDTAKTLEKDSNKEDHFALRFIPFGEVPKIYVAHLTAGYGGSGPYCLVKCLNSMGFDLSPEKEEQLFTKPTEGTIIDLKYRK